MSYLIDGHNLIGKLSGVSLKELDDELVLISMLQVFCRVKRRKVEVYFDGAPPGYAKIRRMGQVTAHFVQLRIEADDAIIGRLHNLGRKARNWIVVTSDRKIQAEARSLLAKVVSSEDFAGEIIEAQRLAYDQPQGNSKSEMSSEEIDYWMRLFEEEDNDDK